MDLSTPGSGLGTVNGNGDSDNNDGDDNTISMGGTQRISQELPFLVTHWLANYRSSNGNSNEETQHREREAMAKIRRATSEIASALASIGAYGTSFRVSALQ